MHYYKRDLSPIKEAFTQCNIKTPYRQNFENYGANMMSKDFKSSLLKSLGSGVKCQSSVNQNRRLSTYFNQVDIAAQPVGTRDIKSFLPPEGCLPDQDAPETEEDKAPKPTIKAMLRRRQLQQNLAFNKLPNKSSKVQQELNESSVDENSRADQLNLTPQLSQDGPSEKEEPTTPGQFNNIQIEA